MCVLWRCVLIVLLTEVMMILQQEVSVNFKNSVQEKRKKI